MRTISSSRVVAPGRDQRMSIEARFIARQVHRGRINCTFLMRKRGRFVETSARVNRSSLFSRRSEIALLMRSPRGWLQSWRSPPLQDLYLTAFMLLYTRPHARVGGGWTCANMPAGATACYTWEAGGRGGNERQGGYTRGKKCRHAFFLSLGRCFFALECLRVHGGLGERSGRNGEAPGSSPLGRSCVNPLREAHTKLVSLSFSLSLLSLPVPPFPRKAVETVRTNHWRHAVSLRFAFSPRVPWFVVSTNLSGWIYS